LKKPSFFLNTFKNFKNKKLKNIFYKKKKNSKKIFFAKGKINPPPPPPKVDVC